MCKINTIGIVTTHETLVKKIALLASVASSPYINAYTLELLATGIHIMSISAVSYTHSDAADEEDSVDLGGRRIIKKKKKKKRKKKETL